MSDAYADKQRKGASRARRVLAKALRDRKSLLLSLAVGDALGERPGEQHGRSDRRERGR